MKKYIANLKQLYESSNGILSNLYFIDKELPACNVHGKLRAEIVKLCKDFERTMYFDVQDEINKDLEDRLLDPHTRNLNPKSTIDFFLDALRREITVQHELVKKLQKLADQDTKLRLVACLITESNTNIINHFLEMEKASENILEEWNRVRKHP